MAARTPVEPLKLEWTVSVVIKDVSSDKVKLHPRVINEIDDLLKNRGAVIAQDPQGIMITFGAVGRDIAAAQRDCRQCTNAVLSALQLPATGVSTVKISRNADLDEELASLPDAVVGVGEAADILGVSKQRVAQLAQLADFPLPIYRLRATPVWKDAEIRKFAASRRRTPGPVRGSSRKMKVVSS